MVDVGCSSKSLPKITSTEGFAIVKRALGCYVLMKNINDEMDGRSVVTISNEKWLNKHNNNNSDIQIRDMTVDRKARSLGKSSRSRKTRGYSAIDGVDGGVFPVVEMVRKRTRSFTNPWTGKGTDLNVNPKRRRGRPPKRRRGKFCIPNNAAHGKNGNYIPTTTGDEVDKTRMTMDDSSKLITEVRSSSKLSSGRRRRRTSRKPFTMTIIRAKRQEYQMKRYLQWLKREAVSGGDADEIDPEVVFGRSWTFIKLRKAQLSFKPQNRVKESKLPVFLWSRNRKYKPLKEQSSIRYYPWAEGVLEPLMNSDGNNNDSGCWTKSSFTICPPGMKMVEFNPLMNVKTVRKTVPVTFVDMDTDLCVTDNASCAGERASWDKYIHQGKADFESSVPELAVDHNTAKTEHLPKCGVPDEVLGETHGGTIVKLESPLKPELENRDEIPSSSSLHPTNVDASNTLSSMTPSCRKLIVPVRMVYDEEVQCFSSTSQMMKNGNALDQRSLGCSSTEVENPPKRKRGRPPKKLKNRNSKSSKTSVVAGVTTPDTKTTMAGMNPETFSTGESLGLPVSDTVTEIGVSSTSLQEGATKRVPKPVVRSIAPDRDNGIPMKPATAVVTNDNCDIEQKTLNSLLLKFPTSAVSPVKYPNPYNDTDNFVFDHGADDLLDLADDNNNGTSDNEHDTEKMDTELVKLRVKKRAAVSDLDDVDSCSLDSGKKNNYTPHRTDCHKRRSVQSVSDVKFMDESTVIDSPKYRAEQVSARIQRLREKLKGHEQELQTIAFDN